jgi:hypothetical protein
MVSALRSRSQLRQFDHARPPTIIAFAARFPPQVSARDLDSWRLQKIPGESRAGCLKAIIVDLEVAAEFAPQRP